MTKKSEVRLPRMPNALEEKPSPHMNGYIHQEILHIPEKNKYRDTTSFVVHGGDAFFENEDGVSVPCPRYDGDIKVVFDALEQIEKENHQLYHFTTLRLTNRGGFEWLLSQGAYRASQLICIALIHASKKIAIGKNLSY